MAEAERKRRKWSQEEMASRIGVSVTTYNRWVQGKHAPSPLAEKRLQVFLNSLKQHGKKGRKGAS